MPDSCCKTVVARCGQRAHPSNIYKVEVSALSHGAQKGWAGGRSGGDHIYSLTTRWLWAFKGPHKVWGPQLLQGDLGTS